MRALLKTLCAVGMIAAAAATSSAEEVRPHERTESAAAVKARQQAVNPNLRYACDSSDPPDAFDGGIVSDLQGVPYLRGQSDCDRSSDF